MSPVTGKNHQDKSRDSESRVVKTERWPKRSPRKRRKRESHQAILSMTKDALSGLWIDNGMASWTSEVVIYWVAGVTVDWVFASDLCERCAWDKKNRVIRIQTAKTELPKTIWNGLFDAMPCQAKNSLSWNHMLGGHVACSIHLLDICFLPSDLFKISFFILTTN